MYVRDIHIQNVKLLKDVRLSFLRGDEERMWTVLVGENGVGKTTILQCIALAASGPDRANQLADVPSLPDRRSTQSTTTIEAIFSFGQLGHLDRSYPFLLAKPDAPPRIRSRIELPTKNYVMIGFSNYNNNKTNTETIHYSSKYTDTKSLREVRREFRELLANLYKEGKNFNELSIFIESTEPKGIDPIVQARARNLRGWFVAGYGVDRKLPSPNNAPKLTDPAFQRLAPLFDKGPIVATGFSDLFDTNEDKRAYASHLKKALLSNSGILPRIKGLELRGQGGAASSKHLILGDRFGFEVGGKAVKVPATWLSQGYQATIAWIADLIGQLFWDAGRAVDADKMEGLVLIDEIDIHLHPTWQVTLIQALKTTFPRIQFVVTTHSPMVLPGLQKDEILRVKLDEQGSVVVEEMDESPAVMTGSELYEAFFGIEGLYPKEIGEALRKYGYLTSDPYRDDAEEAEMQRLRALLRAHDVLPEWEPVARESPG